MSSPTDLCYLSATDAVELFRRREMAPRELMEAVIARAEEVEPTINAFTDTFFKEALTAADAAADAYANGTNRPLEGLALAVKDEPHIEGQRITEGSLLFADQVATDTDPIAQRVIDAGAIVHARTATPEFSMAAVTWSHLHGVTRNPWNPDLTCGGSSGGSGASLAAGTSTLATGSDIAGSIRIPSSLNGLIGFKPPWGRVPEYWPWNRETYAASGPLARTVNDSALFENAISGPLDTDMFSLELMSVLPDGAWDQLTPYIRDWFEDSPDVIVTQWWESWRYGDHMYLELRNKVFGAGFDALVCPTLTRNDIPADLGRGEDADPAALRDMLTFCMTYPFNILGRLPVMSVPIGLAGSTGVPIGMQIVGPVEADLVPYRIAASLEAQQGPFFNTHRPTLAHPH